MSAQSVAYLTDDAGNYITLLRGFSSLTYTRRVNARGTFGLTFAPQHFDKSLFARDRRLVVWRQTDASAAPTVDFVGFCRYLGSRQMNNKLQYTVLGYDPNDLLARRVVAYKTTTAQSDKTGAADNLLKAYVRENLGSLATDTLRSLATQLSVAADGGAAPSVGPITASYDNVLLTLQDIADASDEAGTPLYFDIVPDGRRLFRFETYVNQRGSDRTVNSPITLRAEAGGLVDPFFAQEYREELTVAYVLGQGVGPQRQVKEIKHSTRTTASIFNRIEASLDARDISDPAVLAKRGQSLVKARRPILTFDAKIKSSPGAIYGRDWFFGDKLKAAFDGGVYAVEVRSVTVQIQDTGLEDVLARLDVYE